MLVVLINCFDRAALRPLACCARGQLLPPQLFCPLVTPPQCGDAGRPAMTAVCRDAIHDDRVDLDDVSVAV